MLLSESLPSRKHKSVRQCGTVVIEPTSELVARAIETEYDLLDSQLECPEVRLPPWATSTFLLGRGGPYGSWPVST